MAASVEILPVSNKKEWLQFVKFPYKLYKNDPNWVPHLILDQKELLDFKKHPFWMHAKGQYFLAKKNGKIVGRIAALIDYKHIEFHQEKVGFFGFFESIEDEDVALALLKTAQDWVQKEGMPFFRGPLNPSQNEECGLLIDAFDSPPLIMMTYNPPYYPRFFEKFGLKKAMDLYAYKIDGRNPPPEKLVRVAKLVKKKERLTVRPVDMKNYWAETEKIWEVYNQAWSKNWGFVPFNQEVFKHLAKNLKQAIVPELALIAEIDGKPVGFSVSLPDLNQALIKTNGRLFPFGLLKIIWHSRKIDQVRIVILGVIRTYRNHGIDAILYLDTWRNATSRGYYTGEMSWILENNNMMIRSAKMLGGSIYKTYRMYQKKI